MCPGLEATDVREIEILRDQESLLFLCGTPDIDVRAAGKVLASHRMGIITKRG